MNKPTLYQGGIAIDDRGELEYNNVSLKDVKRFYIVSNHKSHFVRAWHGHKKEVKYVTVIKGCALIGAVKLDNFDYPSFDLLVEKFILSSKKPSLLYIPSGYANGFMNLTKDTKIMFFSTSSLEESQGDDYRYPYDYFGKPIWEIKER